MSCCRLDEKVFFFLLDHECLKEQHKECFNIESTAYSEYVSVPTAN